MKPRFAIFERMFRQGVIVLLGVVTLAFMLWEPHPEGRNANASPYEIYFNDPFLAYAYIASFPFFMNLYHAFKVLRYAGTNRLFSHAAVKAVQTIRFCAMAMIAFVVVGEFIILPKADELPPPIFIGLVIFFGSTVIAAAISLFDKIMQDENGVPSESLLTA